MKPPIDNHSVSDTDKESRDDTAACVTMAGTIAIRYLDLADGGDVAVLTKAIDISPAKHAEHERTDPAA